MPTIESVCVPNPCRGRCEFHGYLWCKTWGRPTPEGCQDYIAHFEPVGAPPSDTTPTGAPAEPTTDPIGADTPG